MRPLMALLGLAMLILLAARFGPAGKPQPPLPAREGPAISSARSWGYQLQNVSAGAIPDAIDLIVVDYSRDGSAGRALSRPEVAALRERADGSRRIVLCYLSIGEAESYRSYWRDGWSANPPAWLGPENAKWKGNYAVRFWEPDWQRLIVADPPAASLPGRLMAALFPAPYAYLDTIIEAGFDGVMLDRVDAYEKVLDARPAARAEMMAFVARISAAAKRRRPGFLVVPQNAEELSADAAYRNTIDAMVKEDLIFGEGGDGVANDPAETRSMIAMLEAAKAAGLPVFTVEYVAGPERQKTALRDWRAIGVIGTFARRALNEPPTLPPPEMVETPVPPH